ncbi:hypothetical protein X766_12580 [Mesorhizobium sp. LSJC255A00]|nr:hypothetical protein X766_12580 [Mesorhizobium sp. LSJC255A00]
MTRYAELHELVSSYGAATMRLIHELQRYGNAIRSGLPAFLGCPPHRVLGVPPVGDFRPGTDYRDAAFSFYHDHPTLLSPITMSLYVEIGQEGRPGGVWVIIDIEFWITGNDIVITVAGNGRPVTFPM